MFLILTLSFLGHLCVMYCKKPVLVTEPLLSQALHFCWSVFEETMTLFSHRPCSISATLALHIWVAHQNQEDLISQSNLVDRGCSSMEKPLKLLQRLTVLLYFGIRPIALRITEALCRRLFKMEEFCVINMFRSYFILCWIWKAYWPSEQYC